MEQIYDNDRTAKTNTGKLAIMEWIKGRVEQVGPHINFNFSASDNDFVCRFSSKTNEGHELIIDFKFSTIEKVSVCNVKKKNNSSIGSGFGYYGRFIFVDRIIHDKNYNFNNLHFIELVSWKGNEIEITENYLGSKNSNSVQIRKQTKFILPFVLIGADQGLKMVNAINTVIDSNSLNIGNINPNNTTYRTVDEALMFIKRCFEYPNSLISFSYEINGKSCLCHYKIGGDPRHYGGEINEISFYLQDLVEVSEYSIDAIYNRDKYDLNYMQAEQVYALELICFGGSKIVHEAYRLIEGPIKKNSFFNIFSKNINLVSKRKIRISEKVTSYHLLYGSNDDNARTAQRSMPRALNYAIKYFGGGAKY